MAIKTQTIVTVSDDLTGQTKGVETITFSINDKSFEIDLSLSNRRSLERSLTKYMEAARPIPPRGGHVIGKKNSLRPEIRAWAKENGFRVSDKGRLSLEVVEAYTKAHSVPA